MQNIIKNWPHDIKITQCRQCVDPPCVQVCPTGALYVDIDNGNIRVIDETKCTGCKLCVDACPFRPQRIIWNPATEKATKCDLCINTRYWGEKGGPNGKQACVEICPQKVIKFTKEVPEQTGDAGYDVNLREQG